MPPEEIEFPDVPEPHHVFDRDCVWFPASVDGKPIGCLITLELLNKRFGLRTFDAEAMLEAFRENKGAIQKIAAHQIENGWIDEESHILLTTRFTRLTVTFDEGLGKWEGRTLVEAAHRMLVEIIGPTAEEVTVEWGNVLRPLPGVRLRIADPSVPFSGTTFLPIKELQEPTLLRVTLAGLWGEVLRARSRQPKFQFG
jgi:hypothetical protein